MMRSLRYLETIIIQSAHFFNAFFFKPRQDFLVWDDVIILTLDNGVMGTHSPIAYQLKRMAGYLCYYDSQIVHI